MKLKDRFTLVATSVLMASPMMVKADGGNYAGINYMGNLLGLDGNGNGASQNETFKGISDTLLSVLGFVRGAGIVVCVLMLAWCAIQLAMSAGSPQKKQVAMEGIKNTMIAVAIIGGCTLIASLAYGLLQ